MSRGEKICKNCGHGCGPRSFKCKHCGHAFVFKEVDATIVKVEGADNEPAKIDWKALQRGDRIKVGGGPVWPAKEEGGENIPMGYRGKFTVVGIIKDAILATGNNKEGETARCIIYMGEPCISKYGMQKLPHRIIKLKPRKPAEQRKKRRA